MIVVASGLEFAASIAWTKSVVLHAIAAETVVCITPAPAIAITAASAVLPINRCMSLTSARNLAQQLGRHVDAGK